MTAFVLVWTACRTEPGPPLPEAEVAPDAPEPAALAGPTSTGPPVVPVPAGAVSIVDGPWAGHRGFGFRLRYDGEEPLELARLPGAIDHPVAAVLATGAFRSPSCTRAFEDRTTPYEPMFIEGKPERLNPTGTSSGPQQPDVLIVAASPAPPRLEWTVGDHSATVTRSARRSVAVHATKQGGAVDPNLVVRFMQEYAADLPPSAPLMIDGVLQPARRPDGLLRARVPPGPHVLQAIDRGYSSRVDVDVPVGGCVYRREKLVGHVTLRASWGESDQDPLAFWFGEATPFPIQAISAVRLRSREGKATDITERFTIDGGGTRVVARDRASTREWLLDHDSGSVAVRVVGPGGAPMSGELGVGEAPHDSPSGH